MNGLKVAIPHTDQYAGVWSIWEPAAREHMARLRLLNLQLHVENRQASETSPSDSDPPGTVYVQKLAGGVAAIELSGTFTKYGSLEIPGPSTLSARRALRAALRDPEVSAVMLVIDSPGGSVMGIDDLARDVAAATKPVWAYLEDMGVSAAYYIASQADRIIANPAALVGSIGAYLVVEDYSQQAANEGVRVHVVGTGGFKGAVVPGTEIAPAILDELQRIIDETGQMFFDAVASGRKMDPQRVRELADGRVWFAGDALARGLIDEVANLEETLGALSRPAQPNRPPGAKLEDATMANPESAAPAKPSAATLAELRSLEGSTAEFREVCIEQGLTLAQAQAMLTVQPTAAHKPASEVVPATAPPLATTPAPTRAASAAAVFEGLVRENLAAGMNRAQATAKACREHPEERRAWVDETNAALPRAARMRGED